jgi:DNA helicase-2/ATP-dependent DNA helicase PcrA
MKANLTASDSNNIDIDIDIDVDIEIRNCLNLQAPKSFFLFAGAGSGKTRSLVGALKFIQEKNSKELRLHGQRVAVITYTNKACDEIKHRTGFDPLVEVSTIHSFVWSLIQGFNSDIKAWLIEELNNDIVELKEKQLKGRGGKASSDRQKSIESKTKRLINLPKIKEFTYSPNGENRGRDSLNHSEVIKIAAAFLGKKPTLQRLMIRKFPILLIDESQDTNKNLIEAFLSVQANHTQEFILGLFGDTMQRIYSDGKPYLDENLPDDWAKPVKQMNHRCPKRIVTLINKIRSDVDNQQQAFRTDAKEGFVRLYILDSNLISKKDAEILIAQKMAEATKDPEWMKPEAVKTLILEHHMAAIRLEFHAMYEPLYENGDLKPGLLDGTLLKFFTHLVLPLIQAKRDSNDFAVASIVRKNSPLLDKAILKAAGNEQLKQIQKAKQAVEDLYSLWEENKTPRFIDILRNIVKTGLFDIPESLKPIAKRSVEEQQEAEHYISNNSDDKNLTVIDSLDKFMLTSFEQIKPYSDYITGKASFDTHQGVKGLEFPRVMVILDDSSARSFLFSYEKLFGVKDKTPTDLKNEEEGKETGIDRTRRLFYVTCSRAEESLAIVAYTSNPDSVKKHAVDQDWFLDDEIEIV